MLRLHVSIQSSTNVHVSILYHEPFDCLIYKRKMKFQSTLQNLGKNQLCRTDRNRNANQSGSNRWCPWDQYFPQVSCFTPSSQWLWVMIWWADITTCCCCCCSPFICLYPSFLISRRLVNLLEHLINFPASCCWIFFLSFK